MLTYTITDTDQCRSLESFLYSYLPGASHGYLQKLVKSAAVTLNARRTGLTELLAAGDTLTIKESGRTAELLKSPPLPVDILFENGQLLVLNKPPGMAMHRTEEASEITLMDLAADLFRSREVNALPRPVNRLDRGTSGAVVLAKGGTAAGIYGRQLKEIGFQKTYCAVCSGRLPDSGELSNPIEGKEALTRFETCYHGDSFSFVLLYPVTGRTHQLRIHLADAGCPILGDKRYGGKILPDYPGFLLHSLRTGIPIPDTDGQMSVCAPLPAGFLSRLQEAGGKSYGIMMKRLYSAATESLPDLHSRDVCGS